MRSDEFLTLKELAARFQCHRNTMSRMLAAGEFPGAIRTSGGRWRIPPSAVKAYETRYAILCPEMGEHR